MYEGKTSVARTCISFSLSLSVVKREDWVGSSKKDKKQGGGGGWLHKFHSISHLCLEKLNSSLFPFFAAAAQVVFLFLQRFI